MSAEGRAARIDGVITTIKRYKDKNGKYPKAVELIQVLSDAWSIREKTIKGYLYALERGDRIKFDGMRVKPV